MLLLASGDFRAEGSITSVKPLSRIIQILNRNLHKVVALAMLVQEIECPEPRPVPLNPLVLTNSLKNIGQLVWRNPNDERALHALPTQSIPL
jgi:hypothetical protein